MVNLKNEFLNLTISKKGAEIVKATNSDGKDIIWIGDKKFWQDHSPVLFPVCGSLLNDKYSYNGKEYSMPKHGFAKESLFEVETVTDNAAVFLLKANEESLKIYPFLFELRIKYTLLDKTVRVDYIIDNKGENEMYFSIGAHEGYMCERVEDCFIEFDNPVTVKSQKLTGPLLNGNCEDVIENATVLPLKSDKYWTYDLIFKDIDFTAVTLKNKNGKIVRAEFAGFSNLLIWSLPDAPYVCIEPWSGLPDYIDSDGLIKNKISITSLAPYSKCSFTHSFSLD
ncbi:MAG: aldose 1-epimerase family protein [Clostridia bacterium]|nr:aldose 1-epimerase family protein [Clostridia bacterium]